MSSAPVSDLATLLASLQPELHHDHLFVPAARADDALAALRALQSRHA